MLRKKVRTMKILFRLAKEAKKYKGLLLVAVVCLLSVSIINLITPWLLSSMTGLVANGLTAGDLQQIKMITFYLLALYLMRVVLRYFASYAPHLAAWNLVKELRIKVYYKLQSLSLDFYRNNESGDLVSRTVNDTATFELLYAHLIPESITNIITVLGVLIILFNINIRLALVTSIPIPFILISAWISAHKVRPNFQVTQKALGSLSGQLHDNFAGIQEIQIFSQQEKATEKVEEKVNIFTTAMLKALKLMAVFHPSVEFITAMGMVSIVGYGGYLAFHQLIAVNDIVAFMLYLSLFYTPITGLANLVEQMQQAFAGAERVIEVLDAPAKIIDSPDAIVLKKPKGTITFNNISFCYVQGNPVLKNVSFSVQPGEMVALVGATGVGKSTIANLIARFYDCQQGEILFDDIDLKQIELLSLRKNIAMVLQDTFLFNGTIAENIAFGRSDATAGEVEKVAKIARIHDEIMEMPDGYDTLVGERGAKLSGGQKQRIAIARALICDVPVLILDEATAAVDVQTEEYIQAAIAEISGTRTMVVIAHRISTVKKADKIIVLEEGRIVQSGTHDELINKKGLYRKMCQIQEKGSRIATIKSDRKVEL